MKKTDHVLAGLLALILFLWLAPFARMGIDPHHDGIMLKPALDVLAGQTLFRDTFMQYGALSCYLQVAALMVQPTLLCLKLMTVAAYAGTLMVLYVSWRLILPRSLALLSCGLFALLLPAYEKNWLGDPWILQPWSSVLAMFFQALGLHALMRIIRDEQASRWGLLLGMASAAVLWCRQPVGILTIGAIGIVGLVLPLTGWKSANQSGRAIVLWTVAGLAGVSLLLLANIALSGALDAWWYQNFTWPRKWAVESGESGWVRLFHAFLYPGRAAALLGLAVALALPAIARRFRPSLPARGMILYYGLLAAACVWQRERLLPVIAFREGGWTLLLPALVAAQAVLSIVQGFAARTVTRPVEFYLVAALAALSLASLPQYYPVPDSWHVFWALAPTLGLAVYTLWRWSGGSPMAVTLVVAAALAPSIYLKVNVTRAMLARPLVTLESPAVLRGMRVAPADAAITRRIAQTIDAVLQRRPDIPTVLDGGDAIYLCYGNNRVNASPYFVTWPGLVGGAAALARQNFITRFRPLLIMHRADWTAVNAFYHHDRYVPLLYLDEPALEIAVPQELADAMGVGAYGAPRPAASPAKP